MNDVYKHDVREVSVKFAAVGVNEFFPEAKKDLVSLHFVSNALAHGFFKGWCFFEEKRLGLTEEFLRAEADIQTLKYVDAMKAWGKDRDLISDGFKIGFINGHQSAAQT